MKINVAHMELIFKGIKTQINKKALNIGIGKIEEDYKN